MEGLLLRIVERKAAFRALIGLALGMFVLVQVLFRTQLGHLPGFVSPPVPPDARLFYSAQDLVALLDSLGPAGRAVYLRLHLVDMAFPLVYGLFLAVLVVWFWSGRGERTVAILASVPFVAILADLAENVCIRIVSAQFAAGRTASEIATIAPWAASLAGIATATKWTAAALSLLVIVTGRLRVSPSVTRQSP